MSGRRLLLPLIQTRSYAAKTRKQRDEEPTTVVRKGKGPSKVADVQLPGEQFDLATLDDNMQRSIERLRVTLNGVVSRVGRVSAALLDPLRVEIDGQKSKLRDYASVSVKDPSTLVLTVYDQSHIGQIEQALNAAKTNLNPLRMGDNALRLTISKPDWKTREVLTREASTLCENARTSIRAARHQGQKDIKRDEKGISLSQTEAQTEMRKLDDLTKKHTSTVDSIFTDAKKVLMDE